MKLNKSSLLLTCLMSLILNACTIQTSTSLPIPPTTTTTSIPIPTETIEPTATAYLWLPYNPNASDKGCGEFIATIPVKETEELSQGEIAQKLFEIYLGHFKFPDLGGVCRLEDFIIEIVKEDKSIIFLAKEQKVDYVRTVQFSVKVKESPSGWVAGNGKLSQDGWIIHKFLIIGVTKINDQYVLKPIGTGP